MTYALTPYGPWSGYQPDQGYYVQQPATVGQLNRLRSYVEYIRKNVNQWMADLDGYDDMIQRLDDRVTAAENVISDHEKRLKTDENRLAELEKHVAAISQTLGDLVARGVVRCVRFVPTATGYREIVESDMNPAQHEVAVITDDSLPMRIEQGNDTTRFVATVKGGTQDLARLGFVGSKGRVTLEPSDTPVNTFGVVSSDAFLDPFISQNGQALIDLTEGTKSKENREKVDRSIAELVKRMVVQENRGTYRGMSVETGDHGWVVRTSTADTSGTPVREYTADINLTGDDTITVTGTAAPQGIRLHVVDQLQRLPVMLTDVRLVARDGHLQLFQSAYDPKTGRTLDPRSVGDITMGGNDTVTVSATGDGVVVDAQPAVDLANKHTDELIGKLTARLEQLESKVAGQAKTIANLQTQVAQYKEVADKSVTAATMDVTQPENKDQRGVVQVLNLFSKDGKVVARLPVEFRFISQKNTLDTGVQINGYTATVGMDLK